jgi:hypothetical protein
MASRIPGLSRDSHVQSHAAVHKDKLCETPAELDKNYRSIVESDMQTNNYGWYQGQLIGRVRQIYPMRGLDFLKEVRAAFPRGEAPRLGSDEALRRVERIDPSFGDWARELATKPRRQDTAP